VCSCNACACEREEEASASEPAAESELALTDPLMPESIARLQDLFAQMEFGGNRAVTCEEVQAFFALLFDKLPLKELELNNIVGTTPSAEAAAVCRSPARATLEVKSEALLADANVDQGQRITVDTLVGYWGKMKALGYYSEEEMLSKLTSALERGAWRQWTAPAPLSAFAAPLPSTTPSGPEPTPPFAALPGSPSCAVLPLQESAEPGQSESDEDEQFDETVARQWHLLLDSASDAESAAPMMLLLPE
jgi:hypothetical protein